VTTVNLTAVDVKILIIKKYVNSASSHTCIYLLFFFVVVVVVFGVEVHNRRLSSSRAIIGN